MTTHSFPSFSLGLNEALRPPVPRLTSIQGVDHVVVRVEDLDKALALWRRLGFTLTPRGFHRGGGSANHTIPFAQENYIELIAINEVAATSSQFAGKKAGPVAIALRPTTSQDVRNDLISRGYDVLPLRDLARPVTLGAHTRDAQFINVSFPKIGVDEPRFFACQHLTRDLVWRPEWQGHTNGALGLKELLVRIDEPDRFEDEYAAIFGSDVIDGEDGSLSIQVGQLRVILLAPLQFERRYPSVGAEAHRDIGSFVGFAVSVADLSTVAKMLHAEGFDVRQTPQATLVLAPKETLGTLIEFREAET